jgi:periplasmic protein TonB
MKRERIPDLNDLAFEGRNQEYGAYPLRKKYPLYLFISILAGVFAFSILIMVFFLENILGSDSPVEMSYYTEVQYYSMPVPDIDLAKLAGSLPKPMEEQQIPVVSDTVTDQNLKPAEEPPPPEEEKTKSDTAGKNQGNAVSGTGAGDAGGIVTVIDVYPKFPGGDEARLWFLRKNIRYPETALKNGVQGVVIVVFIIETDGSLSNIEVNKGIGGNCDEEAVRVVKMMPRWEAARRSGKPVRVIVRMPITFRMPGK